MIGGGGGSALRGIGGAAGAGGGGAAGACGALVGTVTQPATSAANSAAIATQRAVTRREFSLVGKSMAAMVESDSPGMDGVEF